MSFCNNNTIISCIILIVVATPFIRPILEVLNTPTDPVVPGVEGYTILDACTDYLTISLIGIAGMAFYNILSGVIRGLGDSTSTLIYLLVATVINIILDIVFVAVLGMGVGGVALATVIA